MLAAGRQAGRQAVGGWFITEFHKKLKNGFGQERK